MERSLKRANDFKDFYEEHGRKPSNVRNSTSENEIKEKSIASWFSKIKHSTRKIYPPVEKILVDLLGENWNKNIYEESELIRVNEFKEFYEKNKRIPQYKSKPITEDTKKENSISTWFSNRKKSKRGKCKVVLYPSVEKILVNLLGQNWYENEDLEQNSLIKAN